LHHHQTQFSQKTYCHLQLPLAKQVHPTRFKCKYTYNKKIQIILRLYSIKIKMRNELPTKSIITFMFLKWELNMITNGRKIVKKTNLHFFKSWMSSIT
jgi:hypothetical protein